MRPVGLLFRTTEKEEYVMGFFGKLFFGFLAVVAVLAVIGYFLRKQEAKKGPIPPEEDEILSMKTVENVADLNGIATRARYMDKDGQ